MGNTVVLKHATYTRLSALLFAEICAEAGLPPGQLAGRVCVRVASAANEHICTCMCDVVAVCCRCIQRGDWPGVVQPDDSHPGVDKVGFTGSTDQKLRRAIAGSGKKISLELGGKSPFVVFDSADLDSTVEGVVDAIFFNQGQV